MASSPQAPTSSASSSPADSSAEPARGWRSVVVAGATAALLFGGVLPGAAYAAATDPPTPDRSATVPSPGTVTCEDLGLGKTLLKVNGAKKGKVSEVDGVSGVVKDSDADTDGDPESLFVTIKPGVTARAVVAIHGNRANIYLDRFSEGDYGPFHAPKRENNTRPPVNHWLVCGPTSKPSSPSPTVTLTSTPSASETAGGGGSLPVTGARTSALIIAGLVLLAGGGTLAILGRRRRNRG